jgi:ribosomal protein S18 acetylase RimI-like enzyme
MPAINIRSVDLPADNLAIQELDTSFTTDEILEIRRGKETFEIVPKRLSLPIIKRFPIEDLLEGRKWDSGYVAVDEGRICGFIASGYQSWNKRLVIWHFYVAQ